MSNAQASTHVVGHDSMQPFLFEFVRVSDQAPMSGELRFHGESYGWEALIRERAS